MYLQNELTMPALLKAGQSEFVKVRAEYMLIVVQAYNSKPELIINRKDNFEAKLEYYEKAYNEDLTLKSNRNIRIVNYEFAVSLKDYFEDRDEYDDNMGEISDGYHTFNELYYHRMILFAALCNTYNRNGWKSWKHDDGTMFEDYFIVGLTTPEGNFTYHYHKDHWSTFKIKELETAPKWDGHEPKDITRLLSIEMEEN